MRTVEVFATQTNLMQAAAERFVANAVQAIEREGMFSVVLSGGSTPKYLYGLLGECPYAPRVDWKRVQVFWGDERAVSPSHADSNYRMVAEVLLSKVPLPAENIHRICAERPPGEAAVEYERILRDQLGENSFDMILLGMGNDGHTASIFPRTPVVHETRQWVAAHYVEKLRSWRITLTPAALSRARQVVFLVTGRAKAETIHAVLNGPYRPDDLPAQILDSGRTDVIWMLDTEAAHRLDGSASG